MLFKIPIKIDNPEEIDWAYFWEKKVEAKENIEKDWNEVAPKFGTYAVCGGYHKEFISKLILNKEDTVLDLGCGNGIITIPIAKEVKSVTAVDLSDKMLEILNKKAKEENINNIKNAGNNISNYGCNCGACNTKLHSQNHYRV